MRYTVFLFMLLCVIMANGVLAEERTWTAASGSELKAEFQGMKRGLIMLKTPAGKTFGIHPSKLSEADRAYVKKQLKAAPQVGGGAADQSGSVLKPDKAGSIKIDDLPKVALQSPGMETYAALQYGDDPDDVALFIFDREDGEEVHNVVFAYAPNMAQFRTPVRMEGAGRTIGKNNAIKFKEIELRGQFGDVRAVHNVEFIYGPLRTTLLFMIVETELSSPRGKSSHLFGGCLNQTFESFEKGVIQPIALLDEPHLNIRYLSGGHYKPMAMGRIWMSRGDLTIVPGQYMDSYLSVTVTDSEGGKVDDTRIYWDEDGLLDELSARMKRYPMERLRSIDKTGAKYTLTGKIDLGPILGKLEEEKTITH